MEKSLPNKYNQAKIPSDAGLGFGWAKDVFLDFLSSPEAEAFAISGGDVAVKSSKGEYLSNYDSWHIERNGPQESIEDFRKRSRLRAIEYAENYPPKPGCIFCPVLSSEVTAGL